MRIGCDLVNVTRFAASAQTGGSSFLEKIFTPSELADAPTMDRLAGWFAAKEAVAKAIGRIPTSWQAITIVHEQSGRPIVYVSPDYARVRADVSISHDGDYALACALVTVNQ